MLQQHRIEGGPRSYGIGEPPGGRAQFPAPIENVDQLEPDIRAQHEVSCLAQVSSRIGGAAEPHFQVTRKVSRDTTVDRSPTARALASVAAPDLLGGSQVTGLHQHRKHQIAAQSDSEPGDPLNLFRLLGEPQGTLLVAVLTGGDDQSCH